MNFFSVSILFKIAVWVGFLASVCNGGDTCTATFKGSIVVTKYCDIGGCCIPSTGNEKTDPDELCCMTTLTFILILSFTGGPAFLLTLICAGLCLKRYCEKKKNDDRIRRAESARQERRRERRRQRQQQEQEEEAVRIRRYYEPNPEDGPLRPPAYDEGPPGSVPNRTALPMSPPPAYEAIVQEATLPNHNQIPVSYNERVRVDRTENNEDRNERIDVTIRAPAIGGRRPNKRVASNETKPSNITVGNGITNSETARNGITRPETVHKNQVSPSNSFRTVPSPTRSPSTLSNDSVNSEHNNVRPKQFSRPLQIVIDAPIDEPADLLYI